MIMYGYNTNFNKTFATKNSKIYINLFPYITIVTHNFDVV